MTPVGPRLHPIAMPFAKPEPEEQPDLLSLLLASDLAAEVKGEFNDQLAIGLDVAGATQHVLARFGNLLADAHEGPVVLLSLAALQQREGQLFAVVRDAALELIDSGEALAAFPASGEHRRQRRQLLEQFAQLLRAACIADDPALEPAQDEPREPREPRDQP